MMTRAWVHGALAGLLMASSACHSGPHNPAVKPPNPAVQTRVDAAGASLCGDHLPKNLSREARLFYQQHGYQLAWSDGPRADRSVNELVQTLRTADREGLDPADYRADELEGLARAPLDEARAIELDVHATCGYLVYARHLTRGSMDPKEIDRNWLRARESLDLVQALQQGVDQHAVAASLAGLAPRSPQYAGLRHQLARYREMPRSPEVDARVERILINMERWRWLPDDLGRRYILVNIPAFHLDVVEEGRSILGMNVVVGKPANPTPVFSDTMTTVVFSPYWNIPPDIARNETIPHWENDPDYLERNNIEVVSDDPPRFRQRPGRGNSLGLVKFIFPNHFNVYLHDTPAKKLFDKIERDFSHGCVRLERPMDLARYVLRDQPAWTEQTIEAAMQAGAERSVALKEPIPVYLTYFTAWEENGDVQIGNDVYGYDAKQRAAGL